MSNLISRNLIKYLLISFGKLLSSILHSLGVLWLAISIGRYFFSDWEWVQKIPDYWYLFLLTGIVVGLLRGWPQLTISERIAGKDVDIEIKVKDIFSSNEAMITGCNTTFDTSVKEKIISEKSVQGQYVQRYFKDESKLKGQVRRTLIKLSPSNIRKREEKPLGNLNEYEVGTTIVVGEKRKAYLVAIARLNDYYTAEIDDDSFLDALPNMWLEIRSKGNMEDLNCPILGSGFARLKRNRQQLLIELIRSFIAATREGKLTEKITFYVSYSDFLRGHINLEQMKRFLEYECAQYYIPPGRVNTRKGTPI